MLQLAANLIVSMVIAEMQVKGNLVQTVKDTSCWFLAS